MRFFSLHQFVKLIEEVGELANGLNKGNNAVIKDSIGDSLVVLTLMHLTTFSQIILKKDSVKCLTNEQIKIINNVFLDLDECEQEVLALGKIVTIQDTMLKSKIDLLAMYKKQYEYNEELKYQLTASINTQIQRFNALESSIKKIGRAHV